MKDFQEWMVETGKGQQLDELSGMLGNMANRNVTGAFGNAMNVFDKRTDQVAKGANRNAGIVQMIMKYAKMLPPAMRKNLGRQLATAKDMGDDRALNPKARYGNAAQGE